MKPRLLDLFCGAGGAGMGYHRAGFDVIGVDIKPQPNYPFEFYCADAMWFVDEHLADEPSLRIDAIHASPPCQSYTAYRRKGHGVGDGYPDLIAATRSLLAQTGLPWVIENVPGAPLEQPVQLCGSSFGLDVRRHRLFESNVPIKGKACHHSWQRPRFPPATNRTNLRSTVEVGVYRISLATQKVAMGVDWGCTLHELSEMVPPAYTEHIGSQLLQATGVGSVTPAEFRLGLRSRTQPRFDVLLDQWQPVVRRDPGPRWPRDNYPSPLVDGNGMPTRTKRIRERRSRAEREAS